MCSSGTCNMVGMLVLALIAFSVSIAGLGVVIALQTGSGADLLERLQHTVNGLEVDVQKAEADLPGLQQCETDLVALRSAVENCTLIAEDGCLENFNVLTVLRNMLGDDFDTNVTAIKERLAAYLVDVQNRVDALLGAVTSAENRTVAEPVRVVSGTYTATIEGGQSYETGYGIYQLSLGPVRYTWLQIEEWPLGIAVESASVVDPVLKLHSFNPPLGSGNVTGCGVTRPMIGVQAQKLYWSESSMKVVEYYWGCNEEIEIRSQGTAVMGYVIYITERLRLMGQFLG